MSEEYESQIAMAEETKKKKKKKKKSRAEKIMGNMFGSASAVEDAKKEKGGPSNTSEYFKRSLKNR